MPQKTLDSARNLNFLLCAAFFLTGTSTVLIGQVLPLLVLKLGLNDSQAGYFFIAQFSGSIIGTLGSTWFARRNNFILANIFGCLLIAVGVLFLNFVSFQICLFGFFSTARASV